MKTVFDPRLKAMLSLDDSEVVRGINHTGELYESEKDTPRIAALEYLNDIHDVLQIPAKTLKNAYQKVSYIHPMDQEVEYRLSEEKTFFDSTTFGFYQTYLNVPIWRTGLSVTLKHGPNRIVMLTNNSKYDVKGKLPKEENINRFKQFIAQGKSDDGQGQLTDGLAKDSESDIVLNDILGIRPKSKSKSKQSNVSTNEIPAKLVRGRFYMYKYDSANRQRTEPPIQTGEVLQHGHEFHFDLPEVDSSIKDGNYYLVAEITFSYNKIVYLILVDVQTSSVLYIEPLSSGVNGQVFIQDPITSSGVGTNTPNQSNAVLNPFRTSDTLDNLDAPVSGTQHLKGVYAEISNVVNPNPTIPTRPSGSNFNYQVRTDDFAAVNAYYHTDRFFSMVEDLGFPISTYFDQTTFPIPVDHRGKGSGHSGTGNEINAHCVGNGSGGIGHCCFLLADNSDTSSPMGIAADWRVHLHELGGHGILYEHVDSANFGFSHSAGDSFAMIVSDPESNAPDRFLLAPFVPVIVRRSDRPVSTWAWGGTIDINDTYYKYQREQILSTTMFRIYRSIGGDSTSLNRRKFASEMMAYLMLRTISTFMPGTNPATALPFCTAMMATDLLNWTSRGIYGGAYNKVIRWSFEKQGLFQPTGAPTPVTTEGAPPAVDVYIEDGRAGEYQYQGVHWNCLSIWNNNGSTLFSPTHEEPILGATNKAYVKLKNRGTQTATGVNVRAFHCKPGAGLLWPNDFVEMTYTGGTIGTINPNSTEEIQVGPFEWVPNINAYGHDCILMIASATNDSSNIDHFIAGEVIQEWRLVPNDNNIGQRNVHPVAGGGGTEGLVASLHNKSFWAGNPNPKKAKMTVEVELPRLLVSKKWSISFPGIHNNEFHLRPNEKKELIYNLKVGEDFTKAEVEANANKDITVSLFADGALIGGMTYYLDANMKAPINAGDPCGTKCNSKAEELLRCLKLSNQEIKSVKVKKISLDIEMKNGDCKC